MNSATPSSRAHTVAVFGGSFDPPHLGHVQVVEWLLTLPEIDGVLVIPCFEHALGKRLGDYSTRMQLCREAFAGCGSRVEISDIESTLPPPSYTVDTLMALMANDPTRHLRLVMGSDIPKEASRWKQFDRVVELAPPVWVNRGGLVNRAGAPVFPKVSSTNVRRRIAAGLSVDGLVPPGVRDFIKERRLYGSGLTAPMSVVICGCGRVGTALAITFDRLGLPVSVVDHPDVLEKRTNLPGDVARHAGVRAVESAGRATWFICTGDTDVPGVVREIAAFSDPELDCCAVTSALADIPDEPDLPSCRAHPLRAFPPADSAVPLAPGSVFALQGGTPAVQGLLAAIDATTFVLADDRQATYHAAAVLASNLPGALAWEAAAMFRACGVPDPERAAIELMRSMTDNLVAGGLKSLSGPAARNDMPAVAADQAAADAFDPVAGTVHRLLTELISKGIFGRRVDETPETENHID